MSDVGHVLIEIDVLIKKIDAIGSIAVAPIVATALRDHVTETISAGTDAYGQSWPLTEAGGKALGNAAKHLETRQSKSVAVISIQGSTAREIEGRHHYGRVKGGIRRQILPTRKIPLKLANLIKQRLTDAFQKASKNGRHTDSLRNSA